MSDVEVNWSDPIDGVIRQLKNPPPRQALEMLLRAARARVPVVTGHLRSTGTLRPDGIVYNAPYSAPIHWGWRKRNIAPNPWVLRAADTPGWIDVYLDQITEPFN